MLKNQRGATLIGLLLALACIGLLLAWFLAGSESPSNSGTSLGEAKPAARGVTCRMNRQTLEKAILRESARRPGEKITLQYLEEAGAHVPSCPERGRYRINGDRVLCSVHD